MKLPIILTVAALGLPLSSALTQPDVVSTPAPVRDGVLFHGTIAGWLIEEDGSVLVHLKSDDGKNTHWFRTPPSQSSTTQFELLALHAVLRLDPDIGTASHKVEIRGESSSERDGSTRERAMRLLSIGHV